KILVAGFFLAREPRWTAGVRVVAVISLLQILSGVAASLWSAWSGCGSAVAAAARLELCSYGLVTVTGAGMLLRTARRRRPDGARAEACGGSEERRAADWAFVVATGLIPSTSAAMLLRDASSRGTRGAGIAALVLMAIGT